MAKAQNKVRNHPTINRGVNSCLEGSIQRIPSERIPLEDAFGKVCIIMMNHKK